MTNISCIKSNCIIKAIFELQILDGGHLGPQIGLRIKDMECQEHTTIQEIFFHQKTK